MVRVRLRPDVTEPIEQLAMRSRRTGKSRRRLGATPAYARTHNNDVTYAYSLYATLVLARDASPLGDRLHWRVDLESRRK